MRLMTLLVLLMSSLSFAREADDNLTWKLAQARRKQIQSVAYQLSFDLKKGQDLYAAVVKIDLKLNHTKTDLSIDKHTQKITSVIVNGETLKKFPERAGSLDIPKKYLKKETTVIIAFTNVFSKESSGFQRSVDPIDGGEYLFTDFEPYYAHWLFPCFDQPDLKAIYTVQATGPKEWKILHNEPAMEIKVEGDTQTAYFKSTPPMSPYLFFLGAGPYAEWRDKYEDIPLVIYARKTLAEHVDHKRLFETTKKGLKFFNAYFGTPYPYSQYGQIFIPEFAWGGMENPGAVALNERNIFRGAVTQSRLEGRDSLILHEMAHMWFGDLVTMEWWNDLWLNESFATYLASISQDRAMQSKGTWMSFLSTKNWGYWQDQLVTTHPIETAVPDTRATKANFDGITYAKGASSLKQLHFYVGEEGFQKGLESYFKKYAWKNTRREDFINEIAAASKKDLNGWTKKWLQTAGPNRVKVKVTCSEGEKVKIELKQLKSVSGTLSPHRTRLGLYKMGEKLELISTSDMEYASELTSLELSNTSCPDFVLPNQDDMDYALYALDEKSLKLSTQAMQTLPTPLSRYTVWTILSQMVRDQELKASEFLSAAIAAARVETDDLLLGLIVSTRSPLYWQYKGYLTVDEREKLAPEMEAMVWKRLNEAEAGSSSQLNFFDFYASVVQTHEGLERLFAMIQKNALPKGIKLDPDRRWQIVTTLAAEGHPQALTLIADEEKRDASTLGKRYAYAAKVAVPELASKQRYWKEIVAAKDLTFSTLRQAGGRLNSPNYPELSKVLAKEFFKEVRKKDWKKNDDSVELYFESYFPGTLCSQDLLNTSRQEFKRVRHTSLLKRAWLEANDELSRCVKVRAKSKQVSKVI